MAEHVSRFDAPWARAAVATAARPGWQPAWPRIPAHWVGPVLAAIAILLMAASVVIRPAAHPVLVGAVAVMAVAAMAVVRRLEDAAERVVVVLGEDGPAARIVQAIRSSRPAVAVGGAPERIRRAATWDEAAGLVAASDNAELVFAGSAFVPAVRLLDAAGRPAPILTGVEAIQRRLGLVPLDLVGQDRWFRQLGAERRLSAVHAAVKRGVDLAVVTLLGAAVLVVLPLVALAIKLDSPGPVFFTQARIGRGGRIFRVYKFRSMRQDAEKISGNWAAKGDARITRVGRFMRLTRIDELPQLWNVLKGDMTLVGPRPEVASFKDVLERDVPHYATRYAVTPGLTGWAQVRLGYVSTIDGQARKLEHDLWYIKHASLWLDLRILLATVRVVLAKAGC